ncbi:Histone H2A deubiquitinase MYSM1 [Sergentomyia squamirostris]
MSKAMEEEEEIDILGDYEREISNISSGQILSCEYTVHPQWLTDSADLWAESKEGHQRESAETMELAEISEIDWPNQHVCDNFIVLDKDLPVTIEEEVVASSSKNVKRKLKKANISEDLVEEAAQVDYSPPSEGHSRLPSISEVSDCDNERVNQKRTHSRIIPGKRKKAKRKHLTRPSRHKKLDELIFGEHITIIHESEENRLSSGTDNFSNKLHSNNSPPKEVESDEDIDIETEDNLSELPQVSEIFDRAEKVMEKLAEVPQQTESDQKVQKSLEIPEEIRQILENMEIPNKEVRLSEISPVEKYIFGEFFEGRSTKTPDRFLKIRTHIINCWTNSKPLYVGKTAVRSGLKNCGDVNCISRIHTFLEQMGIINFGHSGEYFHYIRPLRRLLDNFANVPRRNPLTAENKTSPNSKRNRRYSDGINVTIQHSDSLMKVSAIPEKTNQWKRSRDIELVKCKQFSPYETPPFSVSITLGALLCLQLHSLTSRHEVMGFLGGCCSTRKISLERYKPCRTSKQSGTMCEMCPVSQVEQSHQLIMEGFQLLGWFHSHPLFPPNPSRTDIETQSGMQKLFSAENSPFVGFILGCIEMNFKCIYVMNRQTKLEDCTYEIDVEVVGDCDEARRDLQQVLPLFGELGYEVVEKFKTAALSLLRNQGISCDIEKIIDIMQV